MQKHYIPLIAMFLLTNGLVALPESMPHHSSEEYKSTTLFDFMHDKLVSYGDNTDKQEALIKALLPRASRTNITFRKACITFFKKNHIDTSDSNYHKIVRVFADDNLNEEPSATFIAEVAEFEGAYQPAGIIPKHVDNNFSQNYFNSLQSLINHAHNQNVSVLALLLIAQKVIVIVDASPLQAKQATKIS